MAMTNDRSPFRSDSGDDLGEVSHAPEGYVCPFCLVVEGIENEHPDKQT